MSLLYYLHYAPKSVRKKINHRLPGLKCSYLAQYADDANDE